MVCMNNEIQKGLLLYKTVLLFLITLYYYIL